MIGEGTMRLWKIIIGLGACALVAGVGGVMALPEPSAPVGWLAYISTPDIDRRRSKPFPS